MNTLELYQQATECLNQGNYQAAIALYEQCLEINSEDLNYYWLLGLAYLLQGEEEEAQEIWLSVFLQGDLENSEILTNNLVDFLEKIAIEKLNNEDWQVAYKIYNAMQSISPEQQNQFLQISLTERLKNEFKQAVFLAKTNQVNHAIEKHHKLLELVPNRGDIWHSLAIIYYQIQDYYNAYQSIIQAIGIDEALGEYYYILGLTLENISSKEKAIRAYQQAIDINPSLIDAYNNLGNIWKELGELDQAETSYLQAINANPNHYGSYINLGNLLLLKNQTDAAIQIYQQALNLQDIEVEATLFYNLALAYERKEDTVKYHFYHGYFAYKNNEYSQAISNWEHFLLTEKADINLYLNLASCYLSLKQPEAAIATYHKASQSYPYHPLPYIYLIYEYQKAGNIEAAISLAQEAIEKLPTNLALKRLNQSLLPVIYQNEEEINSWRNRFDKELDKLIEEVDFTLERDPQNALSCLDIATNYYLNFQGKNDLFIQKKFGNLVIKIMEYNYPQWSQNLPLTPLKSTDKIRLGYISARLGLLGNLFIGYLKHHNRQNFEIYCYDLGATQVVAQERMTIYDEFKLYSDTYYILSNNIEAITKQIIENKLHILVYLDITTEPLTIKLGSLRLAPIQCVSWGHPITSGLKTIDYFLSSDAMESPQALEHYSEIVVTLPKLGVNITKPSLPSQLKSRSNFQINPEAVVYLSCQMMSKYLPQHDYFFPMIAQQVPQAQFIFFQESSSDKFLQRLEKEFAKFNLDYQKFCIILPRLDVQDYLNIHLLSDIFLDTLGWSGGFTTLDAIACNLPIVTCPGELMRGRQSSGMLKIIGVTETIANTEQEYIEIAVKLGLDVNWRQSIRAKIEANNYRLYEDKTCVEALEKFYQEVVQNSLL